MEAVNGIPQVGHIEQQLVLQYIIALKMNVSNNVLSFICQTTFLQPSMTECRIVDHVI